MKVICNTTPFIALASVDQVQLLKEVYNSVFVPAAVIDELRQGGPIPVPDVHDYAWIKVVPNIEDISNRMLFQLDFGERQVVIRALRDDADLVLIDDRLARNIAEYLGLKVKGTLGVLVEAKRRGLIGSFRNLSLRMRKEGIYYSQRLIEEIARELGE
jgi:predicted nucleic acid-binding protein